MRPFRDNAAVPRGRSSLHPTAICALEGRTMNAIAEDTGLVGARFAQAWSSGWSSPYIVASVRYLATSLPHQVELWIKASTASFLDEQHGSAWWATLPRAVRRRAEWRHRLAIEEAGAAIQEGPHDVRWLSFGDVLAVLETVHPDDRLECLAGQEGGTGREIEALRGIKRFRDLTPAT